METHNANAIKLQNQAKSSADMGEMPELKGVENDEELTEEEVMMIVGGGDDEGTTDGGFNGLLGAIP